MLGTCLAALPFAVWGVFAPAAAVALPFGLPGVAVQAALDPLSAFFHIPVLIVGAAAAVCAREADGSRLGGLPLLPLFVAAMMFTLLAADGFGLVLGLETVATLCWALVLAGGRGGGRAGRLTLGMAMLGGVALAGAVALLAPPDQDFGEGLAYAAMRIAPPAEWRGGLVLLLTLVGSGGAMGLFPLHLWLPRAHAAAPSEAGALMSGALTGVGAYVLVRVLLDLCGPATPAWWGMPLLVAGGASAVLGALRANLEADLRGALAASTVASNGFVAMALGTALLARGTDLPAVAALALGSALLLTLAHGLFKALLFLGVGAAGRAAGTHRLARLGGLAHAMPATTLFVLVGAASLAGLPLSAGFAGEWLLLQALVAGPRTEDFVLQVLFALGVGTVGLATALGAAAAVRLVGVAFLGRPRTPRTAAAMEAPWRERLALAALALPTVLLGLFPGLGLRLADAAGRALVEVSVPRVGVLVVGPQADAPGYAPLGVLVLLSLVVGAVMWALWAGGALGAARRGPAWEGGGSAPPPWLPFGDPATEYGPVSFAQPLLRALGGFVLARERVRPATPGSPVAAHSSLRWQDPAVPAFYRPAVHLRRRLSAWLDRVQRLTVQRMLALLLAVLVLLLAAVAASET